MKRKRTVSYTHLDVYKRQDNTVNNGDVTVSVETGDNSLTGIFATMALLSIAGYTILKRKLIIKYC